jgi:hypothetical protein
MSSAEVAADAARQRRTIATKSYQMGGGGSLLYIVANSCFDANYRPAFHVRRKEIISSLLSKVIKYEVNLAVIEQMFLQ